MPPERLPRQFFEADGAHDTVLVFGDAFAAEAVAALRAARHGFAGNMIETTLMGQAWHEAVRSGFS